MSLGGGGGMLELRVRSLVHGGVMEVGQWRWWLLGGGGCLRWWHVGTRGSQTRSLVRGGAVEVSQW